jgi:hypothetical protein
MKELEQTERVCQLKQLKEIETKYNVTVLYCSEVGSKLFGTNHAESDSDYRFIYMPNYESLIQQTALSSIKIGNQTNVKNTKNDIDFDGWSIQHWFNLLRKGETNSLNILFSMFKEDSILFEDKTFTSIIKKNYKKLLTKNMRSFQGYALGQAKKFGIKGQKYSELCEMKDFVNTLYYPKTMEKEPRRLEHWFSKIERFINKNKFKHIKFTMAPGPKGSDNSNIDVLYVSILGRLFEGGVDIGYFIAKVNEIENGYGNRTKTIAQTESKSDWKALSHAFMISSLCIELLETQFMKFPVDDKKYILEIKEGKLSVNEVIIAIEKNLELIDELIETTSLPEKVDDEFVRTTLLGLYAQ